MKLQRYLYNQIDSDLREKMVIIGGPRQVGKTHLSKLFIDKADQYLNWDNQKDRKLILKEELDTSLGLIILDEIHKYKFWRRMVKGYFDKYYPKLNFIVTGSARLDYFRKGGDSMLGRYHYLRLHPLTLNEISKNPGAQDIYDLLDYSGFPEPFLKKDKIFHQRWQRERVSRVVLQDLRDLENVKEISLIELLVNTLQSKVGSALSVKSLQEDLQVSPVTIERWIKILENLYYCYRISPYGPPKIKAVKKAQKLYLWDWSEVESKGARFENLVASQLLKFCHREEDSKGLKTDLRYFKDVVTEKEIDFIVLQKDRPLFAVECKSGDREISKAFVKNCVRLKIPKYYQVHLGKKDYGIAESGRVLPFYTFCKELQMP